MINQLAISHKLRKFIHILTVTVLLASCEKLEWNNLISQFEDLEEYRIWVNEKSIDKKDSVYREKKSFKAFDSKHRLINKGNFEFYFYNGETDQVEKVTYVRMRDRNLKIYSKQYKYNERRLLQSVLRIGERMDTIQSFKYDENGNLIESKTSNSRITQEFEDGLLEKRIEIEGDALMRISEFTYDSLKRKIIEEWVFNGDHKMKTMFEYYDDGNLFRETDSSYVQDGNPNTYIEFMTEYKYDENDSISEIIQYGRIQNELTFKIRGRTTFERKLEKKRK